MRFAILVLLFATPLVSAKEIKIVLWNSEKLFDVISVYRRADDLRAFGEHFKDADIVILGEVTSLDVIDAARNRMGFTSYYTACSDFVQDDSDTFNSLEVGVISRFPLSNVVEFDPSPDNMGTTGEPAEERLVNVGLRGVSNVTPPRGFFTVDVPAIGVTLVATHLKSSRGSAGAGDYENAKKREFVAAAIAKFVANKLRDNSAATVLVAGDMNVGETDLQKNGFLLTQDRFNIDDGDLYDDTHAIFSAGLVDGLHMASLTKALGTETYDNPRFAGAGPIDCMYVAGKQAGDFTLAKMSAETFGSDHFAVSVRFLFGGTVPLREVRERPPVGDLVPSPATSGVRISALLPNPKGLDAGNEWVKLRNDGNDAVNLAGWKLRDKAGNTMALIGSIASGTELKVHLPNSQMPLNNDGDEIELLSAKGRVAHKVRYSIGQVSPGREIRLHSQR